MVRDRRSALSLTGALLLGALLVLLPLARGGVGLGAQALALLVSVVACWLVLSEGERVPLAGLLLAAVLAVMVFQTVPLPAAAHALSPATRARFEGSLGPLGLYPASRPLSLDPLATGREIAKAVGGLAAFLAGWACGSGRRRRSALVGSIGLSGVAVTVTVLGAGAIGKPLLAPGFPFLNSNHLAGLLTLASFTMLGLAVRGRGQARLLWLVAFAGAAVVVALSLSRAGVAAFLAGAGMFVLLAMRRSAGEQPARRRGGALLALGLTGALGLTAFLALDPVLRELGTLRRPGATSKVDLWGPALQIAVDHPLVGVGRGAFESTFPAFKTDPSLVTFTHLENEWIQPAVELGFPAGLLLVGTLAATWVLAARRRDLAWTDVGLLAGTAALALHNLFDFSLELMGVSLPFMAALGLMARGAGAIPVRRRWLAVVLAAVAVVGGGGLAASRLHPANEVAETIEKASSLAEAEQAAREAVWWRPADYLPPAAMGIRLIEEGRCAAGVTWLNRAMLLSPTAPEPHLHVARCLAAAGQGPLARREFRLAWSFGRTDAMAEAAEWFPEVEDLLQVAPATAGEVMRLGDFLRRDRPADAAVAYRTVLEEYGDPRALLPLASALRDTGATDEAQHLARRRTAEKPDDPAAWRMVAELLVSDGMEEEALEEVARGLAAAPGAPALQGFLVERAMVHRRFSEARRLADEMVAHTPPEVAARHLLAARALAAQGRLPEAIERARSAAEAEPAAPGPLLWVSVYCQQAARFDQALEAIDRAAALPGHSRVEFADRIVEIEAARAVQAERRHQQGVSP